MLKVYSYFNSICTQKVFITLTEKDIEYATQNVDLFKNEQFTPAYLKINPKGVVPALDHDGRIVIESTLICEYLDDSFPAIGLMPQDPYLRARARLWSKAVDETLFEATRELSFSAMFRERMRNMTEEQRQGRYQNVGDPIKRARLISTYEEGVDSPYVFQGIGAFEIVFDKMEKDLKAGGPWLVGPAMTLADVNLMPFVARMAYLDLLDVWIAERPAAQAWWRRVQALPSFVASIPGKLSADDFGAMKKYGSAIRQRVTERRDEYRRLPKASA
ncbi:MAG TPA: glutathione S-transferase family protein [Stellaceae bacterium]|nr:glutathione S-transferase family protein [Stellaceae bacterium]